MADDKAEQKKPTKDELVAQAIDRGVPSYEAWAMTVPELTKKLEA